jgi:hypothetical protein
MGEIGLACGHRRPETDRSTREGIRAAEAAVMTDGIPQVEGLEAATKLNRRRLIGGGGANKHGGEEEEEEIHRRVCGS